MPFIETGIPGLKVFEPKVFSDDRGYFYESYNQKTFADGGIDTVFVQDNRARSVYGVVRGLHYQLIPSAQSKLIGALDGIILDVVVDIRKGSPTFRKSFSIELSGENKKQLFVPAGFAHGYSVLSPTAEVMYKVDSLYNKQSEAGIIYNDAEFNIDWQVPADKMILSEKDIKLPSFAEYRNNFVFEG